MRTRALFVLLSAAIAVLVAGPVFAQGTSTDPWPQFQGGPGRTGDAPTAPAPPYAVSWQAAAGIGDPAHLSGFPTPILTDALALVVGREDVTAVNVSDGSAAWTIARALGPSSPPAVVGTTLLFLEGGGDESVSASTSPTPSASPSGPGSASPTLAPSGSPSASPAEATSVSTLVAVDMTDRKRVWSAPLTDVSHTGVLVTGEVAVVGTDDGQISAFSITDGAQRWSIDAGDHVVSPMAASADVVVASVLPDAGGRPALLATTIADGSQAWRYESLGPGVELGAPSVSGDTAYVVASDASVRAVWLRDGTQRWASALYTTTPASPPAVSDGGIFVTDQRGTVYGLDPASGAERWRYATNLFVLGSPIVTPTAVLQPTNDGSIVAIDIASGHQIWHASVADSVVLGLAASSDVVVASHSGRAQGLVALSDDPSGVVEDLTSPTVANPAGMFLYWLLAAVPLVAVFVLLGRTLDRRMGQPDLGVADDVVDPWETDAEDES